ncbi:MAG: hypothetical protein ACN2B6_11920 [Rickettsiales bacterium]
MSAFYERMRTNVSLKLLNKYGTELTFIKYGNAGLDPITGQPVDESDTEYSVTGVIIDYSSFEMQSSAIIDGDKKCTCIGDEIPPIGSILTTSRGTYRVQDVTDIAPDDSVSVVFKLQLRGA